jgi:hypothetical protein
MNAWVGELKRLLDENDADGIIAHLVSLVPESRLTERIPPQRQTANRAVASGVR